MSLTKTGPLNSKSRFYSNDKKEASLLKTLAFNSISARYLTPNNKRNVLKEEYRSKTLNKTKQIRRFSLNDKLISKYKKCDTDSLYFNTRSNHVLGSQPLKLLLNQMKINPPIKASEKNKLNKLSYNKFIKQKTGHTKVKDPSLKHAITLKDSKNKILKDKYMLQEANKPIKTHTNSYNKLYNDKQLKIFKSHDQNTYIKPAGINNKKISNLIKNPSNKQQRFMLKENLKKYNKDAKYDINENFGKAKFIVKRLETIILNKMDVDLVIKVILEIIELSVESKRLDESKLNSCILPGFNILLKIYNFFTSMSSYFKKFLGLTTISLYIFVNVNITGIQMARVNKMLHVIRKGLIIILDHLCSLCKEFKADKPYWMILEFLYNQNIEPFSNSNEKKSSMINKFNKQIHIIIDFTIVELYDREKVMQIQELIKSPEIDNCLDIYHKLDEDIFREKYEIDVSVVISKKTNEDSGLNSILSEERTNLLPPRNKNDPKYTLVLDLDETLAHYKDDEDNGTLFIRPYASDFLNIMSALYEIIIFTAGTKSYADQIINLLDPHDLIAHRLYREHTDYHNGIHIKDLSKLGRSLSEIIIVDNIADNFKLHEKNGIYIKSWYGDADDNSLYALSKILKDLIKDNPVDIRSALANTNTNIINKD